MDIILYTTHCPQCKVLEKKLIQKGFIYTTIDNIETMVNMGLTATPALSVDGNSTMNFKEAVDWLNSLEV